MNLSIDQMQDLIIKVFQPGSNDKNLLIIVDVPNEKVPDKNDWHDRRKIATEWLNLLRESARSLRLHQVNLVYFENTGSNNADFPSVAFKWHGDIKKADISVLKTAGEKISFEQVLSNNNIIIAPTQFSATAPLKVLAKKYGFRAASMPGFNRRMIPALGIDYEEVHKRVMEIKSRLDEADSIDMVFSDEKREFKFTADIRFRKAHASSGLLREAGIAGNLPSGESYIVPYEGELAEPSRTSGLVPVQFEDEIVVYQVENNRAVAVLTNGINSERERQKLQNEPACGNIAEIGFGVLQPFGIKPVGAVLLDEKLGLHIAFGRSDHFGGITSPQSFNDPANVVHIDRIYIPEVQNRIMVKLVVFNYPDDRKEVVIKNGDYVV